MRKPYTSYNLYYLIPFIIWVLGGGVILYLFPPESIFKWVNGHNSSFTDMLMLRTTMLGEGLVIALILLVLTGMRNFRNFWYIITALACSILPSIITQVIKRQVAAPRPLKLFAGSDWIHTLNDWPQLMENSFPSGHTCGAFSLFTLLAVLLRPPYRIWGILFFFLALAVAYSRMYLAVHFFADVYVGSIIGCVFSLIIIAIMNHYSNLFFRKSEL